MRFSLMTSSCLLSLIAIIPAQAAVDYSPYNTVPPTAVYRPVYQVQQAPVLPAFRAQQIAAQTPAQTYVPPVYNPGTSAAQVAVNYRQPAVPAYLPVAPNGQAQIQVQQPQQYAYYDAPQQAAQTQQVYAYAQPQAAPQQQYYQVQPQQQVLTATQQTATYAAPQAQVQAQAPQVQVQAAPTYSQPPYAQPTYEQPRYETVQVQQPARAEAPSVSLARDNTPVVNGLYYALRSGLVLPQDTSFSTAGGKINNEYKSGWLLDNGIGYAFKPWANWVAPRAEGDFSFQRFSIDKHNGTEDPNAYGENSSFTFLASGYLDFTPWSKKFVPFIGAGIGGAFVDFDRYGTSAGGVLLDDNDFTFAYQFSGGVGIPIDDAMMLEVGYRYLNAMDLSMTARDGTKSTTDQGLHMIMIGFRENI